MLMQADEFTFSYANGCSICQQFFFLEFRDRLIENYDELFGNWGGGTELNLSANFSRKWGWYQSVYALLANGDITRLEDITKLEVHKCFTMLSFVKEKNEIEAKQIKSKFK